MVALQAGRSLDRVVFVDVGEHALHRRLVVAERSQSQRHGLIDDLEHSTAGELLVFHKRDVGLDPGRIAVHEEGNRAGRGEHGRLGIAVAVATPPLKHLAPDLPGRVVQIVGTCAVDVLDGIAVHLHHVEHRLPVGGEAFKRPPQPRPARRWCGWRCRGGSQ